MLRINGTKYDNIVSYELEKNQLWSENSGRSYGDMSWGGTVGGNFTKIKVSLYFDSPAKLAKLENDLLSGHINVEFYDTRTRTMRKKVYYRATYTVKINGFYDDGKEQLFDLIELTLVDHKRD